MQAAHACAVTTPALWQPKLTLRGSGAHADILDVRASCASRDCVRVDHAARTHGRGGISQLPPPPPPPTRRPPPRRVGPSPRGSEICRSLRGEICRSLRSRDDPPTTSWIPRHDLPYGTAHATACEASLSAHVACRTSFAARMWYRHVAARLASSCGRVSVGRSCFECRRPIARGTPRL